MKNKLLLIDDEKDYFQLTKRILKDENIEVEYAPDGKKALKKLKTSFFDVILLDYRLPGLNGLEFLDVIKKNDLIAYTKVIMITAYEDVDLGLESIKRGCFDFLAKPFNYKNLIFRIKKAIENLDNNVKIEMLSKPINTHFKDIIGNSKEIKDVLKIVSQIANKDVTILIEGETGTGKELIAQAIHKHSNKSDSLFVPINCSTLTENLLESELFGHEKGAFTGAINRKYGILETAENGIVFLDEINSISLNIQLKLLRFVEKKEFMRIGSNRIRSCNTRIIAASNKNLKTLVKENKFREDLYHRLNVIRIFVPELRNRKEDIPLLVNHFIDIYNKKYNKNVKLHSETIKYMVDYSWTGNIRELKNQILSLVLLNESNEILPSDLPGVIKKSKTLNNKKQSYKYIKDKIMSDFEIEYITNLLNDTNGNVSEASRIAGLSRSMFNLKLKKYNLFQ